MAHKVHSVDRYSYTFSAAKGGPEGLSLWDAQSQRIAYFRFIDETSPLPAPTLSSGVNSCIASFRRSALAGLIDMLRNESPVSLVINDTPLAVELFTGFERVGEEETAEQP